MRSVPGSGAVDAAYAGGRASRALSAVRPWRQAARRVRLPLLVALIAFLYALPHLTVPLLNTPGADFPTVLFFPVGIYVLCAVGLDLAVGRVGIVNFGFAGFFAVGAYGMAWLGTQHGFGYYEALPLTMLMGVVVAAILGLATLRIRGDYLAIVTLAFGLIIVTIIQNTNALGNINGISNIPHPGALPGLDFGTFDARPYDTLLLTIVLATILVTWRLFKSRVGRGWVAIREDEDAAELMGVPTFRFKMAALVIGGAIGGIAGSTFAAQQTYISPDTFDVTLSVMLVAAVVLGGAGNLVGVLVGAALIAYLPERLRGFENSRVLVFAALLTLMMIVRPQGLMPRRIRGAGPTAGELVEASRDVPVSIRPSRAGAGARTERDVLLELDSLTMRFGGVTALDKLSLSVREGEIYSIIGPNGAGKTTVFNAITSVYRPAGGDIRLFGSSIVGRRRSQVARAGAARTFQNIRLFKDMTVLENVLVGADARHATGVFGAVFSAPRHRREESEGEALALELLEFMGLTDRRDEPAGSLPYGHQRRLEIARAMATGASLLLLDEPTAGFTRPEKQEIGALIRALRDSGRTVLLIEHDVELVMGLSDTVAVLNFGHKIAEGPPAEVRGAPEVIEAYLGTDDVA